METLTVMNEKGVEVTLKFERLTIDQEDEWEDLLRLKLRREAMADAQALGLSGTALGEYMAPFNAATGGGACAFATPLGLKNMQTPWGVMQILLLASRRHHPSPGVPESVIREMLRNDHKAAVVVAQRCLPFKQPDAEKKADGPTDGRA